MRSSVCGTIGVGRGIARLEYCTILGSASFSGLQASDCIFGPTLACGGHGGAPLPEDCIRYCRLPRPIDAGSGACFACVRDEAPMFEAGFARAAAGEPGGAALRPDCPESVRRGAEDGGEMGAYHEDRHCRSREAAMDKIEEHLSVGMEPALIPDRRLHVEPPESLDKA
jgi:hypothetical protein